MVPNEPEKSSPPVSFTILGFRLPAGRHWRLSDPMPGGSRAEANATTQHAVSNRGLSMVLEDTRQKVVHHLRDRSSGSCTAYEALSRLQPEDQTSRPGPQRRVASAPGSRTRPKAYLASGSHASFRF